MLRDFLKLHFVVLLAGFTAILGKLIILPAPSLVFWRTLIAAIVLVGVLASVRPRPPPVTRRVRWLMLGNGCLIGLHWTLFFLSVKISNVSVCMIGMATVSFWTAILEPPLLRRRRPSLYEFTLGLVMLAAIGIVYRSDFNFEAGLATAIASALVATVFSIINGTFSNRGIHPIVISTHGMAGACFFCTLVLPLGVFLTLPASAPPDTSWLDQVIPTPADWGWILILALVCTVYAYSQYVELLRRLSVFSVNLSFNLEPVYGIALAALFFREYQQLNASFYIGAAIIVTAVMSYPFVRRRHPAATGNPFEFPPTL